jgi:hypothetical protein
MDYRSSRDFKTHTKSYGFNLYAGLKETAKVEGLLGK